MSRLSVLLFFILLGCNSQTDESTIDKKLLADTINSTTAPPIIYKVNEDSLTTFIAGTEQFPSVQIEKADHSNKVLFSGPRAIIPGKSFLLQSKEDVFVGKEPIKSRPPIITRIEGVPTLKTLQGQVILKNQ